MIMIAVCGIGLLNALDFMVSDVFKKFHKCKFIIQIMKVKITEKNLRYTTLDD